MKHHNYWKDALIIILACLILVACDKKVSEYGEAKRTEEDSGIAYTILHIEGMTCIWVCENCRGNGARAGLTCNWAEWKGK
jgi:hypothetical protein